MILKIDKFRLVATLVITLVTASFMGCTTDDSPGSAATGPGIENPAAAPGSIQPAIGGAGNGGGVSGGGAGAGGAGQGAR